MSSDFNALNRNDVLPIPSLTSTVSSVSSSIKILYIFVIIEGSEPNLPASVIVSPFLPKSGTTMTNSIIRIIAPTVISSFL